MGAKNKSDLDNLEHLDILKRHILGNVSAQKLHSFNLRRTFQIFMNY